MNNEQNRLLIHGFFEQSKELYKAKRKEAVKFTQLRKFVGKKDVCLCLRPLFHAAAHLYGARTYHYCFCQSEYFQPVL